LTFQTKLVKLRHMVKLYELTGLISPDMGEQKAQDICQRISETIGQTNISKTSNPQKIGLSFSIKSQNNAFLFSVYFQAEPAKADEIKKALEKDEQVLRFLLINKKAEKIAAPKKERPLREIETTDELPPTAEAEQEAKPNIEQIEEDLDKILE